MLRQRPLRTGPRSRAARPSPCGAGAPRRRAARRRHAGRSRRRQPQDRRARHPRRRVRAARAGRPARPRAGHGGARAAGRRAAHRGLRRIHRRDAGLGDREGPSADRARRRRHRRPPRRDRGHRDPRLRREHARGDIHQRRLGGTGRHPARAGRELLPLHPRQHAVDRGSRAPCLRAQGHPQGRRGRRGLFPGPRAAHGIHGGILRPRRRARGKALGLPRFGRHRTPRRDPCRRRGRCVVPRPRAPCGGGLSAGLRRGRRAGRHRCRLHDPERQAARGGRHAPLPAAGGDGGAARLRA